MGRLGGYFGKRTDSTAAALAMVLRLPGAASGYLECATTRPFALVVPPENSGQWLSPWCDPWHGLLHAVDCLGLLDTSRCRPLAVERHLLDQLEAILPWLRRGPVVVGPVHRHVVWERLEGRFLNGDGHFLVLLGEESGRVVVHDPEGCPFLPLPLETLAASLGSRPRPAGAVQFSAPTVQAEPDAATLLRIFRLGHTTRREARLHPDGGATGLRALADRIRSGPLASSASSSLCFALPALGLARFTLAELFTSHQDGAEMADRISDLANRTAHATSGGTFALTRNDSASLAATCDELADLEEELDNWFDAWVDGQASVVSTIDSRQQESLE